jgi:hypothetical protein
VAPGKVDLAIYQGDDYELMATFTDGAGPFDLTGYTFAAQIRTAPADDAPTVTAEFVCVITDAAGGILKLTLDHNVTVALPIVPLIWDLQGDIGGYIATFIRGVVTVTAEVTR